MATLTIDTSGAGLHKRGYRKLVGGAPLKETLASALILLSWWNGDRALVDPFCGSGTIPIEAALIGLNIAPGLKREFVSQKWPNIPEGLWKKTKEEAFSLIKADKELRIHGSDINDEAMELARHHAKEAGVDSYIHLQRLDIQDINSRYKYGCIITNPPYGERLGEMREVEQLYKKMGQKFKAFDTWSYYVITSHPEFEKVFGRRADKKRKLYNGRILCNYYQFFGPPPPKGSVQLAVDNVQLK
jgi:putative N6-adenine-specific DNA methylase